MSLSQMRYFVAVAEEGHVGRAAKRLRIAQPPISRHIRALEDELGTRLFERTRCGMRLLPHGEVFLGRVRAILTAVDEAAAATRRASSSAP
jgi:DNA-binding transcriptional LysR family regulator